MGPAIEAQQRRSATEVTVDTGLRALWLVASVLGSRLDVDRLAHEHVGPGRRSDADDLVRIARAEGLKARRSRSSIERLAIAPLPAVASARDGTFFVVAKANETHALVADHDRPPIELSHADLADRWTGEFVYVTRREALGGEALRFGLTWFLPVVQRFRRILAEVLVISVFMQLIALASPLFFQVVIDKVLVHRGLTTLQVLLVGLLVINVADVVLNYLRTYTFAHTTSRMDAILGSHLFRHLVALPIAYFESRAVGQTVARVRELENIRQFLTGSALTLVIDVLFGAIFVAVMAWYSGFLTAIVLASLPFYAAISLLVTPGLRDRVQEKFARGAANQSMLVESLSGIQTLKAMAVEPQVRDRWERQLAAYIRSSLRVVTLGAGGSQAVTLVNKITMAALLWFGAQAVIENRMTIGELVAFNMLAGQLSAPVLRLAQLWQDFQQFKLSIDRLGDIINTPTEAQGASAKQELPPIRGDIAFDRIGFRYKPGGQEILSDFSLDVAAGEVIGIVGRSGSGKSTLTKLLQRLYVPERGRILVDGIDIALLDPSWLRRQIGVVLQENVLFNRSIRENIALADPSLSLEEVMRAAELAGAHEFILELPHGYDTVLEERGSNLSGGQRQRIAIARALVTDPRILIFDEATSALDYESERIIQANMRSISSGRTVLVVAHRLSTVRHADRIVVMDRGRLAEVGPHDVLIRQDGPYARLVRQAAGCTMSEPIPLRPHPERQEASTTTPGRATTRSVVDNVISGAFRARDAAVGSAARTPTELEFLPAALEIIETPVSATSRATALTICGLVVVALGWASLSHVDMVAVAPGKIVPLGQVKVVQPLETSAIRSIHVDDGDHVTAGTVLVELDPTDVQADLASLRYDRGQAALDAEVARLLATRDPDAAFIPPDGTDATLAEANHAQAVAEIRRHLAQIAGVEAERTQKRAALDANGVTIARARDTLPLLEEKNASAKTLWSKKVGARPPVLETEQDLIEKRAELSTAEAASRQIAGELAATEAKLDEIRSAFAAEASDRRTKALQKLAGFDQQIAKAGQRANWRRLVAPVDGTVQNVKIHTPGAVVTTADTLMTIVPDGTGVEIEASVENKDIGFVREGQSVEIKLDAFPFTRWGLIGGTVRKLGRDAAPASSQANLVPRPEVGTGASSVPAGGGDLAYPAKITLSRDWIDVDGRRERIQPGMRVSAEIRTGDRHVIEYILSPVVQAMKEAGRER